MSHSVRRIQHDALAYITAEPHGRDDDGVPRPLCPTEIAEHVYGPDPTDVQLASLRRALRRLTAAGLIITDYEDERVRRPSGRLLVWPASPQLDARRQRVAEYWADVWKRERDFMADQEQRLEATQARLDALPSRHNHDYQTLRHRLVDEIRVHNTTWWKVEHERQDAWWEAEHARRGD